MQNNNLDHIESPNSPNLMQARGGASGNPYTRIHFHQSAYPQFCWPPPANAVPSTPRKAAVHRAPEPPCRKSLSRKLRVAAAAAQAQRRKAMTSRIAEKAKEPVSPSKLDSPRKKGIFGIFDIFSDLAWIPSSDVFEPRSSFASPEGSFSNAPGAYPSSFASPYTSSTPDLTSDESDAPPSSSSLPSSASTSTETLSDIFSSSMVLDTTDSLLDAALENEEEISQYHANGMREEIDFQKMLEEERENVRKASEWAATKEFKEAQRRHDERSREAHKGVKDIREVLRREKEANFARMLAKQQARMAEEQRRLQAEALAQAEQQERQKREQEELRRKERELRREVKERMRKRNEARKRNAALRQQEATAHNENKPRCEAIPEQGTKIHAENNFDQRANDARLRDAKRMADYWAQIDRWVQGDDLKSYCNRLRKDVQFVREGKRLPEQLAGGRKWDSRPRRSDRLFDCAPRPHPRQRFARPSYKPYPERKSPFSRIFFQPHGPVGQPIEKAKVAEEDPIRAQFNRYERIWAILSNSPASTDITLTFASLPWPLLSTPTKVEDLTPAAISEFLFHKQRPTNGMEGEKNRRARLKEEIMRWHPDKFEHRVLNRVVSADRDLVRAGADAVIKVLTVLKETQ